MRRVIRAYVLTVFEVEVKAEEGAEVEAAKEAVNAGHAEVSGSPLGACLSPVKARGLSEVMLTDGLTWEEVEV